MIPEVGKYHFIHRPFFLILSARSSQKNTSLARWKFALLRVWPRLSSAILRHFVHLVLVELGRSSAGGQDCARVGFLGVEAEKPEFHPFVLGGEDIDPDDGAGRYCSSPSGEICAKAFWTTSSAFSPESSSLGEGQKETSMRVHPRASTSGCRKVRRKCLFGQSK